MQKALSGYAWRDWKLMEGRLNRAFTDEEEAARVFEEAGFDPYKKRLKSLTAMETTMGKKRFREVMGGLVMKPQGKPHYSCMFLIRKDDKKSVEAVKKAIAAAYEEGKDKLKGTGRTVPSLESLKSPLRDGDEEFPDREEYRGCYFLSANNYNRRPTLVDKEMNPIDDPDEIYSEMYCKALCSAYVFNRGVNKGIAIVLNHVMKIADEERLGGTYTTAEEAFSEDPELKPLRGHFLWRVKMKTGRSIHELLRELERQEKEKRDYISLALFLRLMEDGQTLSMGEHGFRTTLLFHRQTASILNIPAKYYDLMQKGEALAVSGECK